MNTANTANTAHTAVSFSDIERSTVNLPLIGYTVFWRLAGIRVPHPELATAVATAGFTGFLPEPPSPCKALRRAIEAWISDRAIGSVGPALAADDEEEGDDDELSSSGGRVQQRALVRLINDKEWLVFVIVAEAVDLTGLGLSYGTSLRVLYHKASGGLAITTDAEGVPALAPDYRRVAVGLSAPERRPLLRTRGPGRCPAAPRCPDRGAASRGRPSALRLRPGGA